MFNHFGDLEIQDGKGDESYLGRVLYSDISGPPMVLSFGLGRSWRSAREPVSRRFRARWRLPARRPNQTRSITALIAIYEPVYYVSQALRISLADAPLATLRGELIPTDFPSSRDPRHS